MNVFRIFSGALLALFLVACDSAGTASKAQQSLSPVAVNVLALSSQPWTYTVESFGQLQVADTVNVGVEAAGTVRQVVLQDGQRIAAGELLFELDDKKQALRFEQATASLKEAKSQLAQLEKTLQRFKALRAQGAASEDQLLQARTNYEAAVARLQQATAALNIARTELSERQIVSPVNGVVESESVEVGQYVQPGQVLAVIQADGALQVMTHVNESEVLQLAVGQGATVLVAGTQYPATIESVGRSANPRTGNYTVKLRINAPEATLREGMSAKVSLQVENQQTVLLVPRTALVDRDRRKVVYIVVDGKAQQREVQFGLPAGDYLPVVSGLADGELLIIEPLALITQGVAVTIESADQ